MTVSLLLQMTISHRKCSISASKILHRILFLCNNKQHGEREYNFTFLPCRSQLTPTHPFYYILSFYLRYEEKNNDTVSVKADYMYIRSWIWCTLFFNLFHLMIHKPENLPLFQICFIQTKINVAPAAHATQFCYCNIFFESVKKFKE